MSTNDILLAALLDETEFSSSESFIDKCCERNNNYAQTYDKNIYGNRVIPSKHLAVIVCMDARLDLYQILGLQPGDAHIIRNGGGRLRDAVRSLVCSQTLFRTREVMIIHHTDCGFTYFGNNNQILASATVKKGSKASTVPDCRPFYVGDIPDFMPIIDLEQSIRDDLNEYKQYSILNQNILVRGFLYDTKTGLLKEIK
ncbi:hypothetical protein I4U23_012107 [Adineta vaga]|nr:hypothetical protein I4U23_012107 [Adineta vaga]